MSFFDLPGPLFLFFYAGVVAAVLVGGRFLLRQAEDGPVPRWRTVDPYLIAYLRGGAPEAIRVATLSLFDRGLLAEEGVLLITTPLAQQVEVARPLDRAILARCAHSAQPVSLFDDPDIKHASLLLEHELERQALLPGREQVRHRNRLLAAGAVILLGIASIKVGVALARGRSNIWFLVLFAGGAVVLLGFILLGQRRTRLGDRMIADLQTLFAGLRARAVDLPRGGVTNEIALLLGIFGLHALPGELFAKAAQLFPRRVREHEEQNAISPGQSCSSAVVACGSGSSSFFTSSSTSSCSSSSSCSGGGSSCGSSCGGGGGGCGGCGGS